MIQVAGFPSLPSLPFIQHPPNLVSILFLFLLSLSLSSLYVVRNVLPHLRTHIPHCLTSTSLFSKNRNPQKQFVWPPSSSTAFLLNILWSIMGSQPVDEPAQMRFSAARNAVVAATIMTTLTCALTPITWALFLPLLFVQLEAVARLYDHRYLGRVKKNPSPRSAFEDPSAVFTWKQLAQHASEESAWIAVDGSVYDVTEFVDRHPGGREILLLALGRDATDLFVSYHPFTELPRKILAKYRIGSLATFEHPVYRQDSGFYREICHAVKDYFERTGLDSKAPAGMVYRMAPVYITLVATYLAVYCAPGLPFAARVLLSIVLGVCQGLPLTGWMHDASHTSIGHSERWWWNVGRFSLDYISGSSFLSWRNQHILGHHVYTNVMCADPDLPTLVEGDPRRVLPEQTYLNVYRWQHIYLLPLYGILGIKSRIQDFTEIFSKLTNGPVRVNPIATQDYLRLISSKAIWAFYRIVVPLYFFQIVPLKHFIWLFLATEFTTGYWLAFNFQVSHVSDDVTYYFADETKRGQGKCPLVINDEWAISQVKTTVDYAHNDPVSTYLSGALNYQSAHHLFPTVSQCHYPAITPIIMDIAKKYNVRFNVFDSFSSALYAHWNHLRKMSREGKPAELKLE